MIGETGCPNNQQERNLMRDEDEEQILVRPERDAESVSGLGEVANGTDASLAITPDQVMNLATVMDRTTCQIADAVKRMENCIMTGTDLFEGHGMRSGDVELHLRTAALSIRSIAKEIEEIAGAATVLTTQSLAQMGKQLRRAVVEFAVAQAGRPGGEA